MFKNHPKGLLAAALANMGERFGFYTMMAILVLFLQAKFGLTGTNAGIIYSIFYFSIYILAFIGGLIADKTRNYKGTILIGLILMAVGYFLIAIPSPTPSPNKVLFLTLTCIGLFVIAFGNGLFKGNLQALVGQMYDNPEYGKMRDSGFSLFYMFINVGAIFAPLAAIGVRNWWLGKHAFQYNSELPALCHAQLEGTLNAGSTASLTKLSTEVCGSPVADMTAFAKDYLNVFTTGFHYAFAVAIFAMAISIVIYLVNKKNFPNPKKVVTSGNAIDPDAIVMDIKEVKQRLYALFAVFGVAIFFWMSFHQNGLTLTFFAKEYTDLSIMKVSLGSFTLKGAEIFQSINPFFVVFLTPLVLAFFGWLRRNGKEPSTPKKIAIGMAIAATGFLIMAVGSYMHHLPLHAAIDPKQGGIPLDESLKVTPFLLIGTYFVLTVAELFISPLGISFVSKVAPPQYQGIMQGGWLGATAIGNSMLFVGAVLYDSVPIWMTWTLFVTACTISMFTMIFMLKWLERVAK
ncbi:MAG: peptide MFS transporter [Bacteroidetes bacterium]|nr:peptide MFS transporter [Bacteroidota bacterium]